MAAGGAFSVSTADELNKTLEKLSANDDLFSTVSAHAKKFVEENTGATKKIMAFIQEKRLLTKP